MEQDVSLPGSGVRSEGRPAWPLAEQLPAIVWTLDRELRFTTALGAGLSMMGQRPALMIGRTVREVFATDDPALLPRAVTRRALAGEASSYAVALGGRVLLCRVAPLRNSDGAILGSSGVALDITDEAPDGATRAIPTGNINQDAYWAVLAAAQRQAQELALLDQVRNALTRELDLTHIFRTVVEAIADTFGYSLVSLYLVEDGHLALQHQVGYDHFLDHIALTKGVMARVARTGEAELVEDVRAEPNFLEAVPGITAEVCVPLEVDGKVAGVLNVESTPERSLTDADLRLMTALSAHIGVAISRARLYGRVQAREQQYSAVIESIHEVLFQTDARGCWTWLNPAWTTITGLPVEACLGTALVSGVDPADQAAVAAALAPVLAGTQPGCEFEARFRTQSGATRWLAGSAQGLPAPPGTRAGVAGTLTDVTARREAEEALRRQNEEMSALYATTLGLLDRLDPDDLLVAIVTRAAALLDTPDGYLYVLDPATQELVVQAGIGLFTEQVGYRLPRGAGVGGRVWDTGQPLAVDDYVTWPDHRANLVALGFHAVVGIPLRVAGEVVGVLGLAYTTLGRTFGPAAISLLQRFGQLAALALANARLFAAARRELDERIVAQESLAHLAMHDSLTDLPNRALLLDRMEMSIRRVERERQGMALLVLDLDGFKEVNDTLGHALGDRLLREVAMRLQDAVRAADTVARLGGDEFALVLPGAEERAASRVARKVLRRLAEPVLIEQYGLSVSGSIGIALYPAHGLDVETLLRRADVAMYVAKRQGNRYAIYTPDQDPYSPLRLALSGDLRKALAQGKLVLYYQPKVSRLTGEVTGAEALLRWPHPQQGLLTPDAFLPIGEQSGVLGPLSEWVLGAALRQAEAWQRAGIHLPISVNLTMRDLHDPRLPELVERLLGTVDLPPGRLEVEITEGTAMADPQRVQTVLTRLRSMGVRLAIDDFGTGYSSLAQLSRLAVDRLKIDNTFLRALPTSANDQIIVRAMIDLGHHLGLQVIAEGVTSAETWELLRAMGCDEGQGYFLSPPLPAAEFVAWLDEQAPRLPNALPLLEIDAEPAAATPHHAFAAGSGS